MFFWDFSGAGSQHKLKLRYMRLKLRYIGLKMRYMRLMLRHTRPMLRHMRPILRLIGRSGRTATRANHFSAEYKDYLSTNTWISTP